MQSLTKGWGGKVSERGSSRIEVAFNTSPSPPCISNVSWMCKDNVGLQVPLIKLFYFPNLLLSILLCQAQPAYDHAWQTFQPWKHCLFLAVICAAAAAKKGPEEFRPPPFPEMSTKWTHWLSTSCISQHCSDVKSSMQPTVCHYCLILALVF